MAQKHGTASERSAARSELMNLAVVSLEAMARFSEAQSAAFNAHIELRDKLAEALAPAGVERADLPRLARAFHVLQANLALGDDDVAF